MKRWNVYEQRKGWGPPFMRGQVRAIDAQAAVTVAAKKWGAGHYSPYEVVKHGTDRDDKEAITGSKAHL